MISLRLKIACEASTAHGLAHIASSKPVFVRTLWLLAFLLFASLFIKGFIGLVNKLQSGQVTSSFAASSVKFQFPDVYACFENPISATYAATMNETSANAINARLNDTSMIIERAVRNLHRNVTDSIIIGLIEYQKKKLSYFYPPSLPYTLLADALAHRAEQSVISSTVAYVNNMGFYAEDAINFSVFYHPSYLRCFRWKLSSELSPSIASQSSTSLSVSLFIDGNSTHMPAALSGRSVSSPVFLSHSRGESWLRIPVSDWSLYSSDSIRPDRRSGVRVFLTPPGEYPSNLGSSHLLEPGRSYSIEMSMTEEVYNADQFPCVSNPDQVHVVNPYDQTPYNHIYSYSYCYYYEYQRKLQAEYNFSVAGFPIPWPLRGFKYYPNLTGDPYIDPFGKILFADNISYDAVAQAACQNRKRCSNLIYDARMSSAEWPSSSSLSTYLSTVVAKARDTAARRGLRVPALDALANATSARSPAIAAYAKANLLKLQMKPRRIMCDRVTFSVDYGFENFVADVGGIMGIYLGMSLLTFFELVDLLIDLVSLKRRYQHSKSAEKATDDACRCKHEAGTSNSELCIEDI